MALKIQSLRAAGRIYWNNNMMHDARDMLAALQEKSFNYFLEQINTNNGLVYDNTQADSPASIAGVGFALSCYPIGVHRNYISRAHAVELTLTTLRFFWHSVQGTQPLATGYKGFYYHFLDRKTGFRAWKSELSMVDTAFFIAGVLCALMYFQADSSEENEIRKLAMLLYERVDWQWAQNGKDAVMHGWKPECGFLNYGWEGYNEAQILYILGLGSPTYPLPQKSYKAWTRTYQWENIYGQDFLYSGPLFTHIFSHAWIDFCGVQDDYMHQKNCDFFENSRRAVIVQQEYSIRNPKNFPGYGPHCWGLTACEGPGFQSLIKGNSLMAFYGYVARGVPYGPDDGTLSPPSVLASIVFAPEMVFSALKHLWAKFPSLYGHYGLKSAFNPLYSTGGEPWILNKYFALDAGICVLMLENYQSQFVWTLMKQCPYLRKGLKRAGFRNGYLSF